MADLSVRLAEPVVGGSTDTTLPPAAPLGRVVPAEGLKVTHLLPGASVFDPSTRQPVLLDTPERRATRLRMKADYDANPSAPATLGGRLYAMYRSLALAQSSYFEFGGYATWMYMTTGEQQYADLAWVGLTTSDHSVADFIHRTDLGGNNSRETAIVMALMYDQLYAGFTQSQRDQFLSQINLMHNDPDTNHLGLKSDSDQTTGNFLGLACWYYVSRDHNPEVVTLWNHPANGTLTATGADFTTKRNALEYYLTVAGEGGDWCESSEYNTGTSRLAVFGNECLKTTAGGGLASVDTFVRTHARQMLHQFTPDRLAVMEWGDVENPRQFLEYNEYSTHFMYVGAMADAEPERQALQRQILNLFSDAAHGEPAASGIVPQVFGSFLYDPYATAAPDLLAMARTFWAPGNGVGMWRHSWENGQTAQYWLHFRPERLGMDHHCDYWGDFQLYRKGEFAITHPIAYSVTTGGSGAGWLGDMTNCTQVESFSACPTGAQPKGNVFQFRRVVGQTFGSDYVYVCGTQGGDMYKALQEDGTANYFDPPPVFLHEWTRTVIGLSTADGTAESLMVVERINAVDPQSLTKFTRYRLSNPNEQALIAAAPRWASHLHPRTLPASAGAVTTWTTAGGQLCQDEWLLPDISAITMAVQDELTITPYIAEDVEKKWRLRATPNAATQWTVLIRVVSVRDSGRTHTATLLTGTSSSFGVLIARTGNDNRIVVVNGTQGANIAQSFPTRAQCVTALATVRLRATGFTIGWTQTTATAQVLIADLSSTVGWTTALDGGGTVALTIDAAGVGVRSVTGIGVHTLVVGAV